MKTTFLPSALAALSLSSAIASAAIVTVPGDSNIYGAGHTSLSAIGGGEFPPVVPVSANLAFLFQFAAGGTVGPGQGMNGPDGGPIFAPTNVSAFGGISGTRGDDTLFLVGIFLTDSEPVNPAPATLDFTAGGLGTHFTSLAPAIGQTFFIGDGLTGTGIGNVQNFIAPPGATRLFLGFADAFNGPPGGYGDNTGSLTVNVDQVPEPSSVLLILLGLATSLHVSMRRHSSSKERD